MQTGILGSCFDSFARRAGLLSAILLLCSAPPTKSLGQDVGSSSGSAFHIHGVVLNALTNKPVGRTLVTCMDLARITDSEGRFEFDVRLSIGNSAGGAALPSRLGVPGTVSPTPPTGGETNPYWGGVFVFCYPIESEFGRPVQGFARADGKFSIQNVPPGRYLVLAFSNPYQNLEYRNEEVLRQYESKGTIVTLEPGQKAEVKVSVLAEDEE
jgi:hypothetical protein